MDFGSFMILVPLLILMVILYSKAEGWIRKMDAKTVKTLNWVGFTIAVAGGIAHYFMQDGIFLFIALGGVIIYFTFYNYDKMEEEERKKRAEAEENSAE